MTDWQRDTACRLCPRCIRFPDDVDKCTCGHCNQLVEAMQAQQADIEELVATMERYIGLALKWWVHRVGEDMRHHFALRMEAERQRDEALAEVERLKRLNHGLRGDVEEAREAAESLARR